METALRKIMSLFDKRACGAQTVPVSAEKIHQIYLFEENTSINHI